MSDDMQLDAYAQTFEDLAVEERLYRERGDLGRADILVGAMDRVRKEVEQEALRSTSGPLSN